MLGAHSDCLCVPESQFKIAALRACDLTQGTMDVSRVLNVIKKHWRFQLWEVDLPPASLFDAKLAGSYAALIEWIVSRYGERVGKPVSRLWIDHTPSNVRHAAVLFDVFPDASMIHLIRDGRAVAASLLPLDWGPNRIDRVAHQWVEMVGQGLAAEVRWGASRVARVRYEDLLEDPETTLRRLCRFLEIEYQARMLKADGFRVPEYTRNQHLLVGKAPDPGRVDAWRRALNARQIEIFESVVGDFLRYLGYTPLYGLRARAISRSELARSWLADMLRRGLANRVSERLRRRRTRAELHSRRGTARG
jgi:sulfotransferase family protein